MNYLKNFMMTNKIKKLLIKISKKMKNNKVITHDGSFHADDIFSAAAFSILFEKRGEGFEITRTRNKKIIEDGDYVFDVGEIYDESINRFDHHQPDGAGRREHNIKYSSFGLVWKKFGAEICGNQKVALLIDKKLVAPIDAWDTGFDIVENKYDLAPYLIQHVFFAMLPTWREDDAIKDEMFFKCVEIAKTTLSREIIQMEASVSAEESLIEIYNKTADKRIIILDQNYPFEYILHNYPEPLFVIYPRKTDDSWGVKAVRKDPRTFDNKKDFPKSWGGARSEELQKITGVKDAMFCHHALYLAGAKSKEGAIKLAQIAVES